MTVGRRLTAVFVLALVATALQPATATAIVAGTSSGTLTVPRLATIELTGDLSALLTVEQDGAGEKDYDFGYIRSAVDATILTLNADAAWTLSAKLANNWTCPGSYDKDENDIYIKITNTPTGTIQNGANNYINLSAVNLAILTHTSGVTDNLVDIQTQVDVAWTQDIPGAYSITLTYTLET